MEAELGRWSQRDCSGAATDTANQPSPAPTEAHALPGYCNVSAHDAAGSDLVLVPMTAPKFEIGTFYNNCEQGNPNKFGVPRIRKVDFIVLFTVDDK